MLPRLYKESAARNMTYNTFTAPCSRNYENRDQKQAAVFLKQAIHLAKRPSSATRAQCASCEHLNYLIRRRRMRLREVVLYRADE